MSSIDVFLYWTLADDTAALRETVGETGKFLSSLVGRDSADVSFSPVLPGERGCTASLRTPVHLFELARCIVMQQMVFENRP